MPRLMRTFALLGTLLLAVSTHRAVAGEVDCISLGFTGLTPCSDCDLFQEYVADQALVADCKKCCAQEADNVEWTSASLEVCKHRLGYFSAVEAFIDDHADDYDNLRVDYVTGALPRIVLKGQGQRHSIPIHKWQTEQIVEFLQQKFGRTV